MEETIFITLSIILLLLLFISDKDKPLEELEQELDIPYKDRFHNRKEEEFYHPVTGYKGTRSEMDTYIINREKKLNK